MIVYRGERFDGYNKPKRTPGHKTKSHIVVAKEGDKIKTIRFGQKGACLLYTSPSPRDLSTSRMPSSA